MSDFKWNIPYMYFFHNSHNKYGIFDNAKKNTETRLKKLFGILADTAILDSKFTLYVRDSGKYQA
jgi:hypothetical protein